MEPCCARQVVLNIASSNMQKWGPAASPSGCLSVMASLGTNDLTLAEAFCNMEGYLRISSKLKLGKFSDEFSSRPQKSIGESEGNVGSRTGRVPVRLFVRNVGENDGDLEDASVIDSWDELSFINHAVEIRKDEGCAYTAGGYFTLHAAVRSLIPDLFKDEPSVDNEIPKMERVDVSGIEKADTLNSEDLEHPSCTGTEASEEAPDKQKLQSSPKKTAIKVIRVQGIEPRWDIPFSWVVNNLMNPEFFLHICVYIAASTNETEETT
ncbi:autophagy protein 5 [Asimina triloba]